MNITFHSTSQPFPPAFFFLGLWAFIWLLVWLFVLAAALSRKDFDPVTRLTWVLVIILVPFFGVVVYWIVAPKSPPPPEPDFTKTPASCVSCGTRIPPGSVTCPKCGWSYETKK